MKSQKDQIILGIETSCDDTSLAILKGELSSLHKKPLILSHLSTSQEEVVIKWKGIIPEIAARNHLETITPLLQETFLQSEISSLEDIDLIAVTTHPGLLGPLLIGLNAGKTMALLAEKPIFPVDHVKAHLEAIHLTKPISYPYLGLIVSGGHTQFFLVRSHDHFTLLGETIDDAAGEAFDKGAKILKLKNPTGPSIDHLSKDGDKNWIKFPICLKDSNDCNLSFSGLKTSLKQFVEKNPIDNTQTLNNICASYQSAIVSALDLKLKYALKAAVNLLNVPSLKIVVGGGVAANKGLRRTLLNHYENIYFVDPSYCIDNAAMIANFALRNFDRRIPFPKCLEIDARNKIKKNRLR